MSSYYESRRFICSSPFRRQSVALIAASIVFTGLPAQADAPAGHYANAVGGTVLDTKTQLTWQQIAPTTGGGDGAGDYTWANANSYCSSLFLNGMTGWRLPTVKELSSLVDLSKQSPPLIDLGVFPGAPAGEFWSATPFAGHASYAWFVGFGTRYTSFFVTTTIIHVRCVH